MTRKNVLLQAMVATLFCVCICARKAYLSLFTNCFCSYISIYDPEKMKRRKCIQSTHIEVCNSNGKNIVIFVLKADTPQFKTHLLRSLDLSSSVFFSLSFSYSLIHHIIMCDLQQSFSFQCRSRIYRRRIYMRDKCF